MRFGRLFPALSVFVAAGALIVLTGTGAAAPQPGRSAPAAITANLAAPAALDSYLRSLGVSRASLVVQRGVRNYAGPNCPGKGWNCTTAKRVLQIATDHGKNRVDCPAGSIDLTVPPSQSCTVDQTGPNNVAKCQQRSDSSAAVQHCSITQTGAKNNALVHQTVHADENDDEQTATQTAFVTQNGGSNKSHVKQDVKQKAKDGSMQSQEAHQVAKVDQEASGSGNNFSHVDQDIDQDAKGSAEVQNQNVGVLPAGMFDCAFVPGSVFAPNACANVSQSSDAGKNDSHLKQSIKEDAKSDFAGVSQSQGNHDGGIDGQVHQDTLSGSSSSRADQDKRQRLSAPPGSFQLQYDPLSCCGVVSQDGGTGNSEEIQQSSSQAASEADATQEILLTGSSRSPEGSCSIRQKASNNADTGNNSADFGPPCPAIVLVTSCYSGVVEEPPSGCTESEPVFVCDEYCPDSFGGFNARSPGRQNR